MRGVISLEGVYVGSDGRHECNLLIKLASIIPVRHKMNLLETTI